MSRILDSLSARPIICTSTGAFFSRVIVAPLRSSQLRLLSSLSWATMSATRAPNRSFSISNVIPLQSSTVSWSTAAQITSSSLVIDDTISATSMGWTIYGRLVPFRNCPACAFAAKSIASSIMSIPPPSSVPPFRILRQAVCIPVYQLSCKF